jgi:collagen type II alpha
MPNVVRLVNGGTIQVRTGALQGVGPIGPKGPSGPQGIDGPQGPIGEQGPIGQILQKQGRAQVATANSLAVNTDTLVAFGSVAYDDLSCFTSTTNITLNQAGDYQLSCWLRFDDAASTAREIWFMVGSTLIARKSAMAGTGAPFYLDLLYPYRAAAGEIVNVYARAGSATAVSMGNLVVTRIGSGPQGPVGPPGPQGLQGPQGPQGIQGNDGDANSGFTTYAEMLPH